MMGSPNDGDLTSAEWAKIDAACDRFESAWRAGNRPVIADYLVTVTGAAHAKLLRELILLDAEYRQIRGEKAHRSDYEAQFSDEQELLSQVFDNSLSQTVLAVDLETPHRVGEIPNEKSESTTDPELGRVVGSYRIIDRLGKGGMGTVYRAAHTMIDCERAIKFLKPSLENDPQAVKRFLQEAQATIVHLLHPNIVKTYDLNREGDKIYLVMEVLTGEDLSHLVRRSGPLASVDAVRIIEQAATGLAYAHGLGFVHRDIKPQNIMLTAEGTVKILDLGLVRALEAADPSNRIQSQRENFDGKGLLEIDDQRLTEGGALLGTLAYMPPEQARNARAADARSDLYSLGATLYFLLTGEHPFRGKTPSDVLRNVLDNKFVPARRVRPDIPPSLESIVQRLMSARPSDRFSNGKQLAKALRSWRLQERLEHAPQEFTEPVTFETEEDLNLLLSKLGIISDTDWANAGRVGGRSRTGWRTPLETTLVAPNTVQGPEQILETLEAIYSFSSGKQGISGWQKQNIIRGNADLLRFPHHVLVDRIGVGWKGEVFKARNLETGSFESVRTFAAASLNGLSGDDSQRLQQFMDQIPKIAAVRHPIFPVIRGFDTCRNRHYQHIAYVTTEYIEGRSGRDVVSSSMHGSMNDRIEWALRVITKLAHGLQIAHDSGISHLDIHDKSVRFDSAGNVWLIDLGIAELVTKRRSMSLSESHAPELVTLSATPTGTPYVMPPEQLGGQGRVSSAADIYNLGCTLCYLITGEYPFKAENVGQLQKLILSQSPEDSDVVKQIAGPIRPTIVKMLAKVPEKRPTAGEIADEIDQLLNTSAYNRSFTSMNAGSWLSRTFVNWWSGAKRNS